MSNAGFIATTLFLLFGFISICGFIIYDICQDYKRKKARKLERILERIPCLCGHARWIHTTAEQGDGLRVGCHDFTWDKPCACSAYRRDNLAYLEEVGK